MSATSNQQVGSTSVVVQEIVPAQGKDLQSNEQSQPVTSSPDGSDAAVCGLFFSSKSAQIRFEFFFLVVTFFVAVFAVMCVALWVNGHLRPLMFSALGGFLGGWTFDAKWFYRVTARGRNNQHKHEWQPHKFYWRILIPFVAGLISFSLYLLASSGAMPIEVKNPTSGRIAFGLTFFFGLFMDLILSRIAKWTESIVPSKID